MSRQVKYPVRPYVGDDAGQALRIAQVDLMQAHMRSNRFDAPVAVPGPHQRVHFVPLSKQAAGQVGADEPGCAGENHTLHRSTKLR